MRFVYKGLSAKLEKHTVTWTETDQHLRRLLEQSPRITEITDRPAQPGDEVVLDYAGFCDGEQFPGGTAQMQTLTLGSGMFIPGFEEQLLGKVPGEEVTVHVTFPEGYHAEALAGKAAEFRCKLHAIRIRSPYELDDTFAREVGGCHTLEQMRQQLRQSLQSYSDERAEMELQDGLLRQAADTLEIHFTEEQIDEAVEDRLRELQAQLSQQGLTMEMYCRFLNTDPDTLRADARPTAEAALRGAAAVEEIVRLEGLEPTQEEIAEALAIVCRSNDITMEQLKTHYDARLEAAVIKNILTGKVMRLIRDAAHVTVTHH